MIDTALTPPRFCFSLVLCRRSRPADVRRLASDMWASQAEFGPEAVSRSEPPSATVDPDVRRALEERRLRRTAHLA